VDGVTDWVKIDSGKSGKGKGVVAYTVLANETNAGRSAELSIGDARFRLKQDRPPSLQLPFRERFQVSAPPPEFWRLLQRGKTTPNEPAHRWAWEQLGGGGVSMAIDHDTPTQGNSLLINTTQASDGVWLTLLYMPHVNFRPGTEYPVTVWMKADQASEMVVSVGQNTKPWGTCTAKQVLRVTPGWTKFETTLKVNTANCEPTNNRLVFAAGKFKGKVWIADLLLGAGR